MPLDLVKKRFNLLWFGCLKFRSEAFAGLDWGCGLQLCFSWLGKSQAQTAPVRYCHKKIPKGTAAMACMLANASHASFKCQEGKIVNGPHWCEKHS